jgi:hypothetical protein
MLNISAFDFVPLQLHLYGAAGEIADKGNLAQEMK